MNRAKRCFLLSAIGAFFALSVLADSTGTVSMVGKNVDTSDSYTVGITLVIADKTWSKAEPGDRSHFFTTKRGIYVEIAPNVVVLRNADNTKRVGELDAIIPSQAKKGDKGQGKSDESGIAFTWEVQ